MTPIETQPINEENRAIPEETNEEALAWYERTQYLDLYVKIEGRPAFLFITRNEKDYWWQGDTNVYPFETITATVDNFDPFVDAYTPERLRGLPFEFVRVFLDQSDNDYWWWLEDLDYPFEHTDTPIKNQSDEKSMFDWLVALLSGCWQRSQYIGDFPTIESYLADLRLIEYHSHYVGPVAVYHTAHKLNDCGNRDWEHVRLPR